MRHPRAFGCVTTTIVAALASATMVTPAFGAEAAVHYVALGDSYSSGTGTREYFEESGDCLRGPKAYPYLWAESHEVADFSFVACSGATTADVTAQQLAALSSRTTLVTVSVGGNDVGFADVVTDCLTSTEAGCDAAVDAAEARAREELPAKLDTVYAEIAEAAPNAEVIVVGYPRLNSLEDCGFPGIPGYTVAKRERLNAGADVLAEVIGARASAAGFDFADPRRIFDGHGVCAADEWVNGPSNPLQESFHPNVAGHAQGYLPTVSAAVD